MNKKATRLLSVLLAVLMVVTMIPFMALSAADPEQNIATDPVVWDGLVPNLNGVEATVEDWIFGTGAAAGEVFEFDWYDEHANDIEYDDADTITIKTAAGLAIFTVWSNVDSTDGFFDFGMDPEADFHPLTFLSGKTVKLAADLYLNDPAVDAAEWTNTTMPILWDNMDLTNADHRIDGFVFDGAGYMIYGWKVDQTIVYDETNCQNFGWGLFGQLPGKGDGVIVKNLAMIAQKFDLVNTIMDPDTTVLDVEGTVEDKVETGDSANGLCTVFVGGIYGFALGSVKVQDCFIEITSNIDGQGNGSFGSGDKSYTNANFSAIGALHSNPKVYKELVAADNTGATLTDNWQASRRTFVNCAILLNSTMKQTNMSWRGPGYNTGLGINGWGNGANLNDILVMKAALTGGSERGALTLKGNTHGGCYGLVSVSAGDCLQDASNKVVALGDMIGAFDTAVKTEVDGVRTTFDTWTWTQDTIPMPIAYNAADFIDSLYNDIFKIATPEDMMNWAANAADISAVSLVADIDMAGYNWVPIPEWQGGFAGNGHVIYNLTSTAQGGYTGSNNEVGNMRGGLINKVVGGLMIKDVAFLNMTFNCAGYWGNVHAGMLFGYYGSNTVNLSNVVIAGRNDGKGSVTMGMFGGRGASWSGKVYLNDCAFICTDSTSKFLGNFAGGAKDAWAGYGDVFVTNFYGVNVPAERTNAFCGNDQSAGRFTTLTNGYMTGAKDYTYFVSTTTEKYDTPWTYSSSSDAATAFYAAIEGDEVVKADFLGEALSLGENWTYADGKLPVPKCFDASVAELLTASNGIKIGEASDYLESIGNSIRLSPLAEKQGIRFSFAVDTATLDLLAKNIDGDVVFGVLVAPSALIEGGADITEIGAFFSSVDLEGVDAVLDVNDDVFHAALVNFAGVSELDAYEVDFTVQGFVVIGDEVLFLDSYTCSAVQIAQNYITENAGSEDAEVLATIAQIEAIYGEYFA